MSRRYTFLGSGSGYDCTGMRVCTNWKGESVLKATCFHVVYADLWEEMDSSAVETYGKYNVQYGTVNVDNLENNGQALRSCGWRYDPDGNIVNEYDGAVIAKAGTKQHVYCLIECLWSYGCKDVDGDDSGNNLRELMRGARLTS